MGGFGDRVWAKGGGGAGFSIGNPPNDGERQTALQGAGDFCH